MGIMEFGNALEYAELSLEGFFEDPVTRVYDASVADMTAFESAVMAFSWNLDGGSCGDEALASGPGLLRAARGRRSRAG